MASLTSILDPLVAAAAVGMALAERGRMRELSQRVTNAQGMLAQLPTARRTRTADALARAVSQAEADVAAWMAMNGGSDADLRAGAAALEAWIARDDATTDRFADRLRDEGVIAQETVACLAAADPDLGSSRRTRESAEVIIAAAIAAARGSSHTFVDLLDFPQITDSAAPRAQAATRSAPSPRRGDRVRLQAALAEASARLDQLAQSAPRTRSWDVETTDRLDNLPVGRSTPYINGASDMAALHDALNYQPRKTAAIVGASGRDGVGCSTLALSYCDRYRKAYHRIWWVRAGSRATLLRDLADLALSIDADSAKPLALPDQAALGLDLVSRHHPKKPNLLVFDEAPSPQDIDIWTPDGGVRILIVSRADGWTKHAPSVLVGMMGGDVARKLVEAVSKRASDAGLRAITATMQDVPLGLTLAGRYLRESPRVSPAAYATRYAEAARNAEGDINTRTVATAVRVGLDHIAKRTPIARAIVQLAACFNHTDLPFGLVSAAAPHLPRHVLRDRSGVREALRQLHRHGLIYVSDAQKEPTLSLHPAVQRVVWADLRRDPKAHIWMNAAVEGARRVLGDADEPRARRLTPHIETLIARLPEARYRDAVYELELLLAESLAEDGDHIEAEGRFRSLLSRSRGDTAADNATLQRVLAGLATICAALGQPREAERLARRAFLLTNALTDHDGRAHDNIVELLAELVMAGGRFAEAEPWARRSMALADQSGQSATQQLSSRRRLARICLWTDRREEAADVLQDGLTNAQRDQAPPHIIVASAQCALANLRLADGHSHESAQLMARATEICTTLYGLSHPASRLCAQALVQLHHSHGDDLDARACADRYGIANEVRASGWITDDMTAPFSHIESRTGAHPDHFA